MLRPLRNHSPATVVLLLLSLHWLLRGLLVHGDVLLPGHLSSDTSRKRQSSMNGTSVGRGRGFNSGHEPGTFWRNTSRHLPPKTTFHLPARKPAPTYAPSQLHGSSRPPKASVKHSACPLPAHSLPPSHPVPGVNPSSAPEKPVKIQPPANSPKASLKGDGGCEQKSCPDPLTSTPIGSPCGCVLPIRLKLKLDVAPYAVFPLIDKLEIEVAAATYLKQSQVRIIGVDADSQNQDRTIVSIDLVPLGEKFDNATALLIYERLWQKKVATNAAFFGNYQVVYIHYPGLPTSPPVGPDNGAVGMGPSGATDLPIVAKVTNKNLKVSDRVIAVIVLSSVVALLVCFGAVWILLCNCKKNQYASPAGGSSFTPSALKRSGVRSLLSSNMGSSMSKSLVSSLAPCLLSVKTFSLAELERATDGFGCTKVLGEGGFGRVYHGTLDDKTEVAVKVLTKDNQHGDREFISEVEMLSRLHHRNLVKLIGICTERRRCLVYELISNGSVESHLHGTDKQNSPLDWDARMKIALGAARGLAYLHEDSNPRVIHRDFKAGNILLEKDFTPKVSDFGLAREASDRGQHVSTRVMGTFGYVAPEYAMTGHLLVKSDVYSYGVVMLELLSGRKPVDMAKPPGQENLVTWARPLLTSQEGVEQLVDPLLAGTPNFENISRVAAIASMCVHPEVSQRPFMGEVVQALKLIYNDVDDTCENGHSHREDSSGLERDYRNESTPESSWWQKDAPGLSYGYNSCSFITTMEYSSDPLEGVERPRKSSTFMSNLICDQRGSPSRWQSRSCPVIRSKPDSYRLGGSVSEHGFLAMSTNTNGSNV